jgi:RNA polymerase sigma factor (sigma-70 family)
MNSSNQGPSKKPAERRSKQGEQLRSNEADLRQLASQGNKQQFLQRIIPLLGSLREYIKRRFRIAYLERLITETAFTSNDILDEVVLEAFQKFDNKPKDLSLEQWLYRLANEKIEAYFKRTSARARRRRSLESLAEQEASTLEERMTADAEGEVMLEEDAPEADFNSRPEFTPPSYQSDPSKVLERREEIQAIMSALSRIPQKDRMMFELYTVEGFSKDEIAKIIQTSPEEVGKILDRVTAQLRSAVQNWRGKIA